MHNRRSVDRARRRKVDEPEQERTLGPRPQQPIRCLHCRKQTDPETRLLVWLKGEVQAACCQGCIHTAPPQPASGAEGPTDDSGDLGSGKRLRDPVTGAAIGIGKR